MEVRVDSGTESAFWSSLTRGLTAVSLLAVLIAAVAWVLRADAIHLVARENETAVERLTSIAERQQAQEELEKELWGDSWKRRVHDVLDRERELGLGNGRPGSPEPTQ